jgi:putative addiction module CopG family antidote
MSTLNITLSPDLRTAAERAVASGAFASIDDYIAALIRQDQARARAIESHLVERVESGPAVEMTAADFDAIRRRLDAEVAKRRAAAS